MVDILEKKKAHKFIILFMNMETTQNMKFKKESQIAEASSLAMWILCLYQDVNQT